MPLTNEVALEILGLPSFATNYEILLRYKKLSLMYFPEHDDNSEFCEQEFRNIHEAFVKLCFPVFAPRSLCRAEMYAVFQYMFFGRRPCHEDKSNASDEEDFVDCASEFSEIIEEAAQVVERATELIEEEEQEKLKAERRKAKKKRRKERKKQQKLEKEANCVENSDNPNINDSKESKNGESSASEEDIDPSSAFVAVIAKKQKQNSVPETKSKNDVLVQPSSNAVQLSSNAVQLSSNAVQSSSNGNQVSEEDKEDAILRSRRIALHGNELAKLGHHIEAAALFTESIKLDPTDFRFYGNRSFCYDRLGQCQRALKDAKKAIELCPSWPKGYYRKGRALMGLKQYEAAEECFNHVLQLDQDCEDALQELHNLKVQQIMDKGFTKEQAETAFFKFGSVNEALQNLMSEGVSRIKISTDSNVNVSDEEAEGFWRAVKKPKQSSHSYDIKMDPRNPEGHNSLWVGNVHQEVTEKKLTSLFSKYGEILSIKVIPEKYCAFINYKDKSSPGKAMYAMQGYDLNGINLIIRFPNLPGEATVKKKIPAQDPVKVKTQDSSKAKSQGPVNGDECYFWRTTGCIYKDSCRFRHVTDHKGIDKKPWHG